MNRGGKAILAILLCALSLLAQAATVPAEARGGRLDLSGWNFSDDGTVLLAGQWQFAPGRMIAGEEAWPAGGELLRAPAPWGTRTRFGHGSGTYRLVVDCKPDNQPLGLIAPYQPTAATVFVNGRVVGRQGHPGVNPKDHVPEMRHQVVSLEGIQCPLDIRVQVSNFEVYRAGMQNPLILGTHSQVTGLRESGITLNVFAMTTGIVLGMFGLLAFARWPRDPRGLVFAVYCIGQTTVIGLTSERVFQPYAQSLGFDGQLRVLFGDFFLLAAILVLLARVLFPRQATYWVVAGIASFSVGGVLACALLPLHVFVNAGPLIWIVWPLSASYAIITVVRACMQRERDARIVLAASVIWAAVSGYELVAGWSYMRLGRESSIGWSTVAIALAIILARRFSRALAAEELRAIEQSEKVDLLVRATKAGVLDWDLPAGQLRASDRYREMLCLSHEPESMTLDDFLRNVHADDRHVISNAFAARLRERGEPGVRQWGGLEFRMDRETGGTLWAHCEAISIHGEDGRTLRHICTFIDISHLKATEEQLERAQARLLEQARRAGMAQVATNVLHNVGNVLNSVNVSAHMATALVQQSRAARIADVAQLLEQHQDALQGVDAKAGRLPAYVRDLADVLRTEQETLLAELGRLSTSVDHIKKVVTMQQGYAGASGLLERTRINELVRDALRLQQDSLQRHGVEVTCDLGEAHDAALDRTRVMQILINLLENARHAMDAVPPGRRRLRIAVHEDAGWIELAVQDSGCGIDPADLGRLFSHGFTTRESGHGFGLHSCAIAANEMGGVLQGRSDGPGRGATFTLRLPLRGLERVVELSH